jgi:hypothetical protein
MGCVAAARSMPRRRSDASQYPRTCSGLPSSCPAERGYLHELVHGAPRQPLGHAAEKLVPLSSGTKRIRHPQLGELTFQHVVLQLADDPEQKIVTFSAGEQDQAAIAALLT